MRRYLLKFTKEGEIRYISHLDLLRVFQRAFRRTTIKMKYSQGYNPHARIGFTMPLSLGFESTGEYVDIEIESEHTPEMMISELNSSMPRGLRILECIPLKETGKTASAAAVVYAAYLAEYRGDDPEAADRIRAGIRSFLEQETITVVKYSKKKKKDIESEIRPLIHSMSSVSDSRLLISMMLRTGSGGTLNPETLLRSLAEFCGTEYLEYEWLYRRTEMFFVDQKKHIRPLTEFKG